MGQAWRRKLGCHVDDNFESGKGQLSVTRSCRGRLGAVSFGSGDDLESVLGVISLAILCWIGLLRVVRWAAGIGRGGY